MKTPVRIRKGRLSAAEGTPAEEKWRPVVEEWRQSGRDITSFCRDRGLVVSAFSHWKREIPKRDLRRQAEWLALLNAIRKRVVEDHGQSLH